MIGPGGEDVEGADDGILRVACGRERHVDPFREAGEALGGLLAREHVELGVAQHREELALRGERTTKPPDQPARVDQLADQPLVVQDFASEHLDVEVLEVRLDLLECPQIAVDRPFEQGGQERRAVEHAELALACGLLAELREDRGRRGADGHDPVLADDTADGKDGRAALCFLVDRGDGDGQLSFALDQPLARRITGVAVDVVGLECLADLADLALGRLLEVDPEHLTPPQTVGELVPVLDGLTLSVVEEQGAQHRRHLRRVDPISCRTRSQPHRRLNRCNPMSGVEYVTGLCLLLMIPGLLTFLR